MLNEKVNSPFDELKNILEINKKGIVVLCTSTRAALLLKRKILQSVNPKAIMDTDIMSANELIARMSRGIGLESKVIGGLGREMIVSEILSGLKHSFRAYSDLDLRDYVKGISEAIGELIQAGVEAKDIEHGKMKSTKITLLSKVFALYRKRLSESSALDAKELSSRVFENGNIQKLKRLLDKKLIVAFCCQQDELASEVSASLSRHGIDVLDINTCRSELKVKGNILKLYARQGRQLSREVARRCKYLMNESDCDLSDICIAVPPSSGKEREVTLALEWAGIPCSDPIWQELYDHPAASSLSMAMDLIAYAGEKLDAFFYCGLPYFGLEHFERRKLDAKEQADQAASSVTRKSISAEVESYLWRKSQPLHLSEWANARNWNKHFRKVNEDDHQMDKSRADFYRWAALMKEKASSMNRKATWDEHCDSLEGFFEEFYTIKGPINDEENDPLGSSIEIKALIGIQQVIDKVRSAYRLMADSGEKIEWAEFSSTIQQAFKEKRIMLRGSSNTGVGIAEPKDMLGLDFKHIIFYEATESNFPKPWNPGWVLTENDRKRIEGLNDQSAETRNRLAKEQFMIAACAAHDTICFALPSIGDDEKPVNNSIWVYEIEEELARAGKKVEEQHTKRRLPAPESIDMCVTENERTVRIADDSVSLENNPSGKERLKEKNYNDEARIAKLSSVKFNDEYKWSPSMLNTYLKCGLSIIPRYLDGLRERDEYEELPSAMTTGDFLHAIAQKILLKIAEVRGSAFERGREALIELIKHELSYDNSDISGSMSEELWQLYKGQYMGLMIKFAESELLHAQNEGSIFREYVTERDYTTGDDFEKLSLGDISISFKARVDRIDVTKDGKAAIFDYKTGSIPDKNSDVQLDFYSLIASKVLNYTPIASAYFPLSRTKGCTRKKINSGRYVDEYQANLGFKDYVTTNKSLLPHKLEEVPAILDRTSEKVAVIIKSIKAGDLLTRSPSNSDPCKYCIRGAFCWKDIRSNLVED